MSGSSAHGCDCVRNSAHRVFDASVLAVGIHSANNNNLLYHDSLNFYFSAILQNSIVIILSDEHVVPLRFDLCSFYSPIRSLKMESVYDAPCTCTVNASTNVGVCTLCTHNVTSLFAFSDETGNSF